MPRRIELNHIIEPGMITYKGLPGPVICDYLSRHASRALYAEGTEFQIGRIDMVSNTGTYLDTPFHRYADGCDLAEMPLGKVTALPGVVVRHQGPAIGAEVFAGQGCVDPHRLGSALGPGRLFHRPPISDG